MQTDINSWPTTLTSSACCMHAEPIIQLGGQSVSQISQTMYEHTLHFLHAAIKDSWKDSCAIWTLYNFLNIFDPLIRTVCLSFWPKQINCTASIYYFFLDFWDEIISWQEPHFSVHFFFFFFFLFFFLSFIVVWSSSQSFFIISHKLLAGFSYMASFSNYWFNLWLWHMPTFIWKHIKSELAACVHACTVCVCVW